MFRQTVWIILVALLVQFLSFQAPVFGQENGRAASEAEKHRQQGNALRAAKKHAEAAAAYSRSLELVPKAVVYCERGHVWIDLGQRDKAIADFDAAIRLDPKSSRAYLLRGTCYGNAGDHDRALSDLKISIEIDPKDSNPYFSRAFLRMKLQQYALAQEDLDAVIRLQPDDEMAYKFRSMCWGAAGDLHRSIADLTQAIKLRPDRSDNYAFRGKAYQALKNYPAAIADYEAARRIEPKKLDATNALAMLLATCPDQKVRDYRRGIALATSCCEWTNWKEFPHLAMLATAYAQAGQFEEAVKWQSHAIHYAPKETAPELRTRLKLYRSGKSFYR